MRFPSGGANNESIFMLIISRDREKVQCEAVERMMIAGNYP